MPLRATQAGLDRLKSALRSATACTPTNELPEPWPSPNVSLAMIVAPAGRLSQSLVVNSMSQAPKLLYYAICHTD
jgi:hypothetical protein